MNTTDLGPSGRLYLGSPEVVGKIWGTLIGEMFNGAVAEAEGRITSEERVEAQITLYQATEDAITGVDPAYEPVGTWNSDPGPGGMGAFIRSRLEGKLHPGYWEHPFTPAKALVYATVGQVNNLLADFERLSEEELRAEITRLTSEATHLVLGTAMLADLTPPDDDLASFRL